MKLFPGQACILMDSFRYGPLAGPKLSDQQDRRRTVAQFPNHRFHRPHAGADRLEKWHSRKRDFRSDGQTWIQLVEIRFHEINPRQVRGVPFA
jgi:hypothetical protein